MSLLENPLFTIKEIEEVERVVSYVLRWQQSCQRWQKVIEQNDQYIND